MSWLSKAWQSLVNAFRPAEEPATSAADVMAELRKEKTAAADPEAWREAKALFQSQVFSPGDRQRVWKRTRRRFPGEALPWEPPTPSTHDLDCLQDINRDLGR